MKKILCTLFILMGCSVNAQINTSGTSWGELSLVPSREFDIPTTGYPQLIAFDTITFEGGNGVTPTCSGPPGIYKLPDTFFVENNFDVYCNSIQLPPGKQWIIDCSLSLSIVGMIELRGSVYYGQTSILVDKSQISPRLTSKLLIAQNTNTAGSLGGGERKIKLQITATLPPQHPSEPVYVYVVLSGVGYGPFNSLERLFAPGPPPVVTVAGLTIVEATN